MKKRTFFLVFLIILVGFFLRVHGVTDESLWLDETYAIRHAQSDTVEHVALEVSTTEAAPFGYYVFLHQWINWFGNSEFSVRFPSVLFGVLSILILYLVCKEVFDTKTTLLATLLFATSMTQVLYSQEARLYSLFTLLTLLSAYFFTKLVLSGKKRYWLLYFITILTAVYTNYVTLFLMFAYTVVLLWRWNESRPFFWKWLALHVLIVLAATPLIPLFLHQFRTLGAGATATYLKLGVPAVLAQLGVVMFAIPLFIVTICIILILLLKKRIEQFVRKPIPQWCSIGIIAFCGVYTYLVFSPLTIAGIPLFRVPITHSYFLVRHSLFLAPLLYVFLAYVITRLRPHVATACIILLLLTNTIALTVYYTEPTKAQWEEAVSYIHSHSDNPLVLLDSGGLSNSFLFSYYDTHDLETINVTWTTAWRQSDQLEHQELLSIVEDRDFWLILSRNAWSEEEYTEVLSQTQVDEQEFYKIHMYKYD